MTATVANLLQGTEEDAASLSNGMSSEDKLALFAEMWEVIRQSDLASGQARSAKSDEALLLARRAFAIANRSAVDVLQVEAHRMMAYALNANEQYEESLAHYASAIALLEQRGEFGKAARNRLGLVAALFMTGRYSEAVSEAGRADEWFTGNGDQEGHARLCANLGNLYHRLDEHARAVEYQNTAIRIFQELRNPAAMAHCYLNLGDSLSVLDRFEEADLSFERCQRISQKLGLTDLNMQARYNRAYLSFLRGRYSEAIQGFDELRGRYNDQGSLRHSTLCDLDESEIYLHLNLTNDALVLAKRAADNFARLGMRYEEAKATAFVGIALSRNQQYAEATEVLHDSQRIFEEEKNLYWAASLELFRAEIKYIAGRFWEAQALCNSAYKRFAELEIPSKRAMALVLLTRVALELGSIEQAASYSEQIKQLIKDSPIPLHLFPCHSITALVAEHLGDTNKAQEYYALAAHEIEVHRAHLHQDELRVTFFKGKQQVYESLTRLALGRGEETPQVVEAYNWCERAKSRGLVDLLAQHIPAGHPQGDQSLLKRIGQLHEELNSFYVRSEPGPNQATAKVNVEALETKKSELARSLRELSKQDPEYVSLRKVSIVSVEDMQRVMPNDCTLVEYFIARDEVLVFLITKERAVVRRHLCTLSRVQHLQERLRLQLDKFLIGADHVREYAKELRESAMRHLQELYGELIEPFASDLNSRHLIIVPHGTLHYFPFHAFHDGRDFLIDRFTISYAPSASVLRYCIEREPVENQKALIIGVADERAPLIADEVAHLRNIVPQSLAYFGRQATRNVFRQEAAEAAFVHVATHAVFRNDNPMFSSFKVSDGWITALDLYSMNCHTNLMTLSGCKSGMSQLAGADELLGLMRGFLYAGARSLLLSLWDVNDRSTLVFMRAFYQSWLGGASKSKALQTAMQQVRAEEPHPYFWAPFMLLGNP